MSKRFPECICSIKNNDVVQHFFLMSSKKTLQNDECMSKQPSHLPSHTIPYMCCLCTYNYTNKYTGILYQKMMRDMWGIHLEWRKQKMTQRQMYLFWWQQLILFIDFNHLINDLTNYQRYSRPSKFLFQTAIKLVLNCKECKGIHSPHSFCTKICCPAAYSI